MNQPNVSDKDAGRALLSAAEVAARLAVPSSWVLEQARQGVLPSVQVGKYRRFDRATVDQWIAQQRRGGKDRPSRP